MSCEPSALGDAGDCVALLVARATHMLRIIGLPTQDSRSKNQQSEKQRHDNGRYEPVCQAETGHGRSLAEKAGAFRYPQSPVEATRRTVMSNDTSIRRA